MLQGALHEEERFLATAKEKEVKFFISMDYSDINEFLKYLCDTLYISIERFGKYFETDIKWSYKGDNHCNIAEINFSYKNININNALLKFLLEINYDFKILNMDEVNNFDENKNLKPLEQYFDEYNLLYKIF